MARARGPHHGTGGPVQVRPIDSPYLLHDEMMATAEAAGFCDHRRSRRRESRGFCPRRADCRMRAATGSAPRRPTSSRRWAAEPRRALGGAGAEAGVRGQALRRRGDRHRWRAADGTCAARGHRLGRRLQLAAPADAQRHRPAAHLKDRGIAVLHDSPGVGRNLQEHPCASPEFWARDRVTFLSQLRWDKIALNSLRWALTGRGPMATQVNPRATSSSRTAPHFDRPDLQVMVNPIRFDAAPWGPLLRKEQEHVFWAGVVQLHPESRGWVELKKRRSARRRCRDAQRARRAGGPRADAPRVPHHAGDLQHPADGRSHCRREDAWGSSLQSDDELDAVHPRKLLRRATPDEHMCDGNGRSLGGRSRVAA